MVPIEGGRVREPYSGQGQTVLHVGATLHLRFPLLQYITGMSLVTVFKCYSVPRQGITWTKSMSPWVLTLTPKPIPPWVLLVAGQTISLDTSNFSHKKVHKNESFGKY